MAKIHGKQFRSMRVVSVDGEDIGFLSDVIVDIKTGAMVDLVVKPDENVDPAAYRTEGGLLLISAEAVRSVKDNIIVETKK